MPARTRAIATAALTLTATLTLSCGNPTNSNTTAQSPENWAEAFCASAVPLYSLEYEDLFNVSRADAALASFQADLTELPPLPLTDDGARDAFAELTAFVAAATGSASTTPLGGATPLLGMDATNDLATTRDLIERFTEVAASEVSSIRPTVDPNLHADTSFDSACEELNAPSPPLP